MRIIISKPEENPRFNKNLENLKSQLNIVTSSGIVVEAVNFMAEDFPRLKSDYEKEIKELSNFKMRYFKLKELVLEKQKINNKILVEANFKI